MISHSQSGYKIVYKQWRADSPLGKSEGYIRLVFNDSMSGYYAVYGPKQDPLKKSGEYGNIIYKGHAAIYNKNTNLFYGSYHGHYKTRNKKYIVYYPPREREWTYSEGSKKILGYDCKKAYWVNEYFIMNNDRQIWFSDSTVAWYAEELKLPFGPSGYIGLPGVVLEVTDQQHRSFNLHLMAIKIEKDSFSINLPKDAILISPEELRKMNKK